MSVDNLISSINLDQYPIHELDSQAGQQLLADCHKSLETQGAVVLEGFLKNTAVGEIVADLMPDLDKAYFCQTEHNVYLIEDDDSYGPDHPRNKKFTSTKGLLAYDQISENNLLRELYGWPALRHFIAQLMGVETLYPYEDALSPININVNMDKQELNWHYDNSEFSITLMLNPAKEGGVYEYVPFIRTDADQQFDRLDEIISGKDRNVNKLLQSAGALVIFKGKYTIHRVTPTVGDPRLVAVMALSPEPGKTITARTRQIFYGREE